MRFHFALVSLFFFRRVKRTCVVWLGCFHEFDSAWLLDWILPLDAVVDATYIYYTVWTEPRGRQWPGHRMSMIANEEGEVDLTSMSIDRTELTLLMGCQFTSSTRQLMATGKHRVKMPLLSIVDTHPQLKILFSNSSRTGEHQRSWKIQIFYIVMSWPYM